MWEPTPASSRQILLVPTYPSPAELIEKRYLQDTKAHFFFSKKYFYLHKTIKSEQLFPEKLWPSGAAAGHMRWSLFTSNSFAWQYSAGTFSFFWCKDHFSVPLVLPLLALRTDRSVFTTATWIRQVPLYTAQLESMERGSGWWIKHTQPSFKCYQVAKSTFGAGETHFLLQKTIFNCSVHLQKRDEWAEGEGASWGAAMPGAAGVSAGLLSPWGCKGLLRVWSRPVSPASPVVRSQGRGGWAEAQRSWGCALAWAGQGRLVGCPGARWHCPPWWLAWRLAPAWASFHLLWKTRREQVNPCSRTLQPPAAIFKTISIPKQSRRCLDLPWKGRLAQERWMYLQVSIPLGVSSHPFCWSWSYSFAWLWPHMSQKFVVQQHRPLLPSALQPPVCINTTGLKQTVLSVVSPLPLNNKYSV